MSEESHRPVDETRIEQFESAILKGDAVVIDDALPGENDPSYLGTLIELVQIDQEYHWKAANSNNNLDATIVQPPLVESYVERFEVLRDPEHFKPIVRHEFYLRQQYGQSPEFNEYRERFPGVITKRSDLPEATVRAIPGDVAELGDQIGPYRLIEKIGEGGFGVVYLAEQEKPVKRQVALKVIKAGMDSREVIARFEAERQALALMDHDNIAKVLDAGATDSGRPFFVMQWVQGVPITEYCDTKQLSVRERLELFMQVCKAIQHAHQKGIIHRDIKPSNVLVSDIGGEASPKVIDFGIAKAIARPLTDNTLQTQSGQVIGTPQYMSPEQADTGLLDIDTRSDVYSLGVVLYELLVGSTPIEYEALRAAAYHEMMRMIREDDPPPPSSRLSKIGKSATTISDNRRVDSSRLTSTIRGELDWIVMKALDKDRARRYESASAFAADIENYINGEPVAAGPPSAVYKIRKFVAKHRLLFSTAASFALLVVGGLAVISWLAFEYRSQRNIARNAQTTAETAEKETANALEDTAAALKRAEIVSGFMINVLRSPDPLMDGRNVTVAEILKRAEDQVLTEFEDDPPLKAALLGAIGKTWHGLGRPEDARPLFEIALKLQVDENGNDLPEALETKMELGKTCATLGDMKQAIALNEESLAKKRKLYGDDDPTTLLSMTSTAIAYHGDDQIKQAIRLFEQALSRHKKVLGDTHWQTISTTTHAANAYLHNGQTQRAIDMLKAAIAVQIVNFGETNPATIHTKTALANAYDQAGELKLALRAFEEVFLLSQQTFGPHHPETLIAKGHLAKGQYHYGDVRTGITTQEQTLTLSIEHLSEGHPVIQRSMIQLAQMYVQNGQAERGLELEAEAEQQKLAYQKSHASSILSQRSIARAHLRMGEFELAVTQLETSLEAYQQHVGAEHPETLSCMSDLARAYQFAGRLDDAVTLNESALALQTKELGVDHPQTLATTVNLAASFIKLGRIEEAVKLQRENFTNLKKKLGADHPLACKAASNLAVGLVKNHQYQEALQLLEATLPAQTAKLGENHFDVITTSANLAETYFQTGQTEKATNRLKDAVARLTATVGEDHPRTLQIESLLAEVYGRLGRYKEARSLHQRLLKSRRDKLGENHIDTLGSMSLLIEAHVNLGENEQAATIGEQALGLYRENFGEVHVETQMTKARLASAYAGLGRFKVALQMQQEVVDWYRENRGPTNVDTLTAASSLAAIYSKCQQFDKAIPLFEETLKLQEEHLGKNHANTMFTCKYLAYCFNGVGRYRDEATLRMVNFRFLIESKGLYHADTLAALSQLAYARSYAGDHEAAAGYQKEVLEGRQRVLGEHHADTLQSMANLAYEYHSLGRVDEGTTLTNKTYRLCLEHLEEGHNVTMHVGNQLANCHQFAERFEKELALRRYLAATYKKTAGAENDQTLQANVAVTLVLNNLSQWREAQSLAMEVLPTLEKIYGKQNPDTLLVRAVIAYQSERQGEYEDAVSRYKTFIDLATSATDEISPENIAFARVRQAYCELKQKKFEQAEATLQAAIEFVQANSKSAIAAEHKGLTGELHLLQSEFQTAEPLLLQAYNETVARKSQLDPDERYRIDEALERIVLLYTKWKKPELAAKWRAKRNESPPEVE